MLGSCVSEKRWQRRILGGYYSHVFLAYRYTDASSFAIALSPGPAPIVKVKVPP